MRPFISLIRTIFRFARCGRSEWYLLRARWNTRMAGGCFVREASVMFDVPVRMDGEGRVILGKGAVIGYRMAPRLGSGEIMLQARGEDSEISLGENTIVSNNLSVISLQSVRIGSDCQIGDLVSIFDCDFHEIDPKTRNRTHGEIVPVVIGNNVWLGSRVQVLKGVTIGDNTVVAAGSIVTKSLPANVLAAGIPARVIRQIG